MAKLKWFRLYTEAVNDPKLRILSDKQFRIWFNLLCLAAEGEERGVVREEPFLLAVKVAGGDEQLLNETLVILERLKIVKNEHNSINFINFKKRQYEYRSSEPEEVNKRVGKCREQKKEEEIKTECNENETRMKRECNENETRMKQHSSVRTDNRFQNPDLINDVVITRTREGEISEKEEKSAVEEIANHLFFVTGRTASAADYISITETLNSPDAPSNLSSRLNLIKSTMAAVARQKKNKDPSNGKINSFSYFKNPILNEFQKKKTIQERGIKLNGAGEKDNRHQSPTGGLKDLIPLDDE